MPRSEHGRRWWLVMLLVLLLTACDVGGEGERPTATSGPPTVVVVTVAPQQELPTLTPTSPPPPTVTPTPTPPAPLAATVNGQYIFLADYERLVSQYEQSLADLGTDLSSGEGQAQLDQARQEILDGLIDDALIAQGAAALGVSLGGEELEAQVEADIAAGGGQEAFDQWLGATGQTRDDYKEMLRRSLISQRAWDLVTGDVAEAVEQVHVRMIMIASEADAQEILDSLAQGADFVALTRERSLDLATKDNGGDLGWFPRGVLAVVELENAAFGLQPGGVSAPIAAGDAFYIIQVVERETARSLTPEMLLLLKQNRFDQWLEELRAAAVVERFVVE